MTVLLLDYFKY